MRETSSIKQYNSQSPKTILGGNTNTMKKTLSLLLAVALVLSLFASVGSVASAASAGQQLKDLGVIKGDTSGSLNETSTWDKQDLAVLISRLVGEEEIAAATPAEYGFNDIEDDYYDGYITWALQKGYITGNSERDFGFNEPVSYKVLNAVILRVLGYDTTGANYDTTEDLAVQLGLSEATDFDAPAVRGIAYGSILAALNTVVKGGTLTLGQKLGVVYGTAATIKLSVPAGLVANGSDKGDVVAKVYDKDGYLVKNYNGTVTFASTNTTNASLAATTVAAVNGVATVKVTAGAVANGATALITASATGLTGSNAQITTVAQKLTKITLSADPTTIAADTISTSAITPAYFDQSGLAFTGSTTGVITGYVSSNTAVLTVPVSTVGSVRATALTGSSSISVTLDATLGAGVTASPVTVSTAVVGSAYKLAIDTVADAASTSSQSVVVRVLDANGNQLTGNSGTVITLAKDATVDTSATAATVAGKATFTVANTTAETVSYTASATGLVSATSTAKFVPSVVTQFTVAASPATLAANGSATSKLTATLKDANGNVVSANGYKVKFVKTTNASATATFADTTLDTVNGTASVTVTATANVATDVFTATLYLADGTTTVGSAQTVSVSTQIQGAASKLNTTTAAITATAGADTSVVVTVQDAANTVLTADNGRVVTLTAYDSTGAVVKTLTANTVNGTATFTLNLTTAGSYTVVASASGLTATAATYSAGRTATITAGTVTALKVTSSVATLAADGASNTALTIQGVDAYGNVNNSFTAPASLAVAAGSTSYGALTGSGLSRTFTANLVPGSTVITVTADGLTSATATVNTITVGAASKLVVVAGSAVTAGVTQSNNVKVYVQDANGNLRTNDSTVVTLTIVRASGTTTTTAAAAQGIATFTLNSTTAETVTVKADATVNAVALTQGTTTQVFVPGAVTTASIVADITSLPNNGSSVSNITFTLKDANGNVVTGATGTVTFALTAGSDFATLLNSSATIVNGTVLAAVQSKLHAYSASNTISVTATYTKGDGTTGTAVASITAQH
jgi:adhesin/invasin